MTKVPCLRSLDVVLICCDVSPDEGSVTAKWVQFDPRKINHVLGKEHKLIPPKGQTGPGYIVQIPVEQNGSPITPVHTDLRFPITSVIPMANS